MIKIAAPAWARFFGNLSSSAKQQISNTLKPGTTRSISSTPLGIGQEGMVFPSVTGGAGDSAVKVFFDRLGDVGKITPKVTASPEFQSNVVDKLNLLKSQPSVFPEVYKQHPRGYAMERLAPMSNNLPTESYSPLQGVRSMRELLEFNNKSLAAIQEVPWWKKLLGVKPTPSLESKYYVEKNNNYKERIREMFHTRHNRPEHPLADLMGRLRQLAPTRNARSLVGTRSGAILPTNTGPVHIRDFWANTNMNTPVMHEGKQVAGMEYHNIMQRANGQAVISDPIIKR